MKNFFKISLLTAIIFTSFGAFADDAFILKTNSENEKSIIFLVNEAQAIDLSIIAEDNVVVYEQKIRTTGAAKKIYNLDALPDGSYTLKLESEFKLTTYQILIENDKAQLSAPSVKEFFRPLIVKEKGMVILNFKTKVEDVVGITVLNEYNDELVRKELTKAKSIQKFDVTNTDARELTFIVSYKGEEYIETISLR